MLGSIRELAGCYVRYDYSQEPARRAEAHGNNAAWCTKIAKNLTGLAVLRPELSQEYTQLASQQTALAATHTQLQQQERQTPQAPLSKAEYNKRIDNTLASIECAALGAIGLFAYVALTMAVATHITKCDDVATIKRAYGRRYMSPSPRDYGYSLYYTDPKDLLFKTALVHTFSMPFFIYGFIACSAIYLIARVARQGDQIEVPPPPIQA